MVKPFDVSSPIIDFDGICFLVKINVYVQSCLRHPYLIQPVPDSLKTNRKKRPKNIKTEYVVSGECLFPSASFYMTTLNCIIFDADDRFLFPRMRFLFLHNDVHVLLESLTSIHLAKFL